MNDDEVVRIVIRFVGIILLWGLAGAACGIMLGLLVAVGSQLAYPLVTGGKPILSVPPMVIIMYEGTILGAMLGAIIFPVVGVIIGVIEERWK